MIGIYSITNIINSKIYIGQSINIEKRFAEHRHELNTNRHPNKHLQGSWNKYGSQNFTFSIIEECSIELLDEKEQYYIAFYNSMNSSKGYNKNSGGNLNKKMSEESKQKLSNSLKGHPVSEETIRKLSESHLGKHLSEEAKRKVSEYQKGRKTSPETRKKMSESQKGRKASEETKRKLSESHKGHKWTEEQRQNKIEYYKKNGHPSTGRKASPETIKKLSESHKGRTPWNKGIPATEEQKEKQRQIMKGRPRPGSEKMVMDVTNNITYKSVAEAMRINGLNHIYECVISKRKHCGGREWKYI